MTSQAASLKTKTIQARLPIPSPVNVDDNLKKINNNNSNNNETSFFLFNQIWSTLHDSFIFFQHC